jgi:two-component system KDP operon response regulator KdpE
MSEGLVLVVDDEPQILRALQTNLRGAGYDVGTATSAQEAVRAAARRPPDAVILDLVLPDGSGIDVARELRTWSAAPILVLGGRRRSREGGGARRGRRRLRPEAVRDR